MLSSIKQILGRKKRLINYGEKAQLKLSRVLTLTDLTALGVGSTLGLGVYVLAGMVSRNFAGPATCLSFLIAAVASALAGFCYSEFAARVPKAGSAYIYSYVCIGEFVAFVIGWNMALEYIIGTASIASGLSTSIDALFGFAIRDYLLEAMPTQLTFLADYSEFLAPYPDFLAAALILVLTVLLTIGIKESTTFNNICTLANIVTIIVIVMAGCTKIKTSNWFIAKDEIPAGVEHAGNGGFFPFGFSGVMAGAAKCFFAFVGFDGIASTSEEAKNPQKNIPLAIFYSLVIAFFAYFGISTVLTMMWPYYDQDPTAPFTYAFEQVDMPVIKWIVTIGAIFSLCAALLGVMLPLPRIIYSMSEDGIFYKVFSKIHSHWKTPAIATAFFGVVSAIMALVFNLQALIDMMSIGTLLAYTIVAACVLTLRYENSVSSSTSSLKSDVNLYENSSTVCMILNTKSNTTPNAHSSSIVKWAIFYFCLFSTALCFLFVNPNYLIAVDSPFFPVIVYSLLLLIVFNVLIIYRQPKSTPSLFFVVPCVPIVPCVCIFVNIYLMLELDRYTWIRFLVWMTIGLFVYFSYSVTHSEEAATAAAAAAAKQERQTRVQVEAFQISQI